MEPVGDPVLASTRATKFRSRSLQKSPRSLC